MKTIRRTVMLILIVVSGIQVHAQYTFFKEQQGFAIEVSLSNTKLVRLPAYRNAITSLIIKGDMAIGGTSADEKLSPYIFTASLSKKEMVAVKDIGEVIKGQRAVATGFFRGKNDILYAGTLGNKINDSTSTTGHLIGVATDTAGNIHITDLGAPVKGEGVFALTADTSAGVLYGLSFPSGIFFIYNITSKEVKTFTSAAVTKEEKDTLGEYSIKPEKYLSRALLVDKGLVYGSRPVNRMFVFDPSDNSFTDLNDQLPEVWGRRTLGQADALIRARDGRIYGGNSGDGQLFEINTSLKKIRNLGKPIMMNRIRGLAFGADNKLYGIAGAPPGYAHFFSYDPVHEGFSDYGNPQFIMKAPGIEQGIEWRGFRLGSIAETEDGKYIVLGEDDTLSQLLIYPVGN
ncbi:MAG: hypothetical protein H0X41_06630 [Chitinophagaceae bacterium]|nr:hypothetical protein [Chitinophagaceae bacterium]